MILLAIDKIRLDGGTQSRAEIDRVVVAEYAEDLSNGERLPPPVVFHDGADYWLADGFHRVHAYRAESKIALEADVRQGSRRDAILFSVGANAEHGLRRTNADKRRAVELLLNDEEWSQKSDRWIAEKCGVGHPFTAKVRSELESDSSSIPRARTGQDGKVRRMPQKKAQEEPVTEARDEESTDRLPEDRVKKSPRAEKFIQRTGEVRKLIGDGLTTGEIAERLGVHRSTVHSAKREIAGLGRKGKVRRNPLAGLTGFAVEFTDTWQDAIPSVAELCSGATADEHAELLTKLEGLMFSLKTMIREVKKGSPKGVENEHEQVREAASESD